MIIGIVGLGFLGGCLAKSLRKLDNVEKIIALDINEESLIQAKNENIIDDYTMEIDDKFHDCDIVFIATPVGLIVDYAKKLDKVVKDTCIITDTGSTKKSIIKASKELTHEFIGGHPMVGSERSGYATSIDYLFENSYFIMTKSDKNKKESLELLESLIKGIKALPIIIDEDKHDYVTASISHVPHVIAATLVNMVKNLDDSEETMKTLAAGGFKDITRIASSDPTMWENIVMDNHENIKLVLKEFRRLLDNYEAHIDEEKNTYDYFVSSKTYRDSFVNRKINGNTMPEVNISIKDENGSIARVATILSDNNIGIRNIEVVNNRENNYGALRVVFANTNDRDNAFEVLKETFDLKKVN